METIVINIFNTVGNSFCVEASDGDKVYMLIKSALQEEKKIKLSFQNVEMITSAFLNTAVGQVYRDFPEGLIKKNLSVEEMAPEDIALLRRVISTAKIYYKDPESFQKSIDEIMGD